MPSSLTISIYAAIVSTLVFLWRIFEFFYDRYPSINIETGQSIEGNNHFCIVQITNRSKQKRFVDAPLFIADKLFKETGYMFGYEGDLTFPFAIDSGEQIEFKIPYSVLTNYKKKYKVKRIRAIIKDTFGKKYKSKWTDI